MPKQLMDELLNSIEDGTINKLKDINSFIQNAHANYYSYEWTWAWDRIQSYYGVSLETITKEEIIHIVEDWLEAVVSMDQVLYEDAKKEFSYSSRTGFGADGNDDEQRLDFEQVRGNFEKNTFVSSILKHIDDKTNLRNKMIEKMNEQCFPAGEALY
jgi:hypothetical protein